MTMKPAPISGERVPAEIEDLPSGLANAKGAFSCKKAYLCRMQWALLLQFS